MEKNATDSCGGMHVLPGFVNTVSAAWQSVRPAEIIPPSDHVDSSYGSNVLGYSRVRFFVGVCKLLEQATWVTSFCNLLINRARQTKPKKCSQSVQKHGARLRNGGV